MKTIEDAVRDITRRLEEDWHQTVSGGEGRWPQRVSLLGELKQSALEADFDRYRRWALEWQEWQRSNPAELERVNRTVRGTTQRLPVRLEIPDADAAAQIVGGQWPARLARGRGRHQLLANNFPNQGLARIVRATDAFSDIDVDLLISTALWFRNHDAAGLTPRQVPIPGLHSKWLNTNRNLVSELAGKADLGLTVNRPSRVHFGYLDPAWTGRRFDICTAGDAKAHPAYSPSIIVICENRDTAQLFPPIPGGIAVEGDGLAAPGILSRFSWITECPRIIYWGDIDSAGYEILNSLRVSGVPARSVLMDRAAYVRYEHFGTFVDHRGRHIPCAPRKKLTELTEHERVVYHEITDPDWSRVRRIEQEKIPLAVGLAEVVA